VRNGATLSEHVAKAESAHCDGQLRVVNLAATVRIHKREALVQWGASFFCERTPRNVDCSG